MADIVVVGAGPVGLWTALQLRKRLPDAVIRVYERHEVYQRTHVLRLDHWSLLLYGRASHDASAKQFFRDVTGRALTGVQRTPAKSLYLRTSELEEALLAYAARERIEIVRERMPGVAEAEAAHPECLIFIAADGARSGLRSQLLGEDAVEHINLQHVLEVKYEEAGKPVRASVTDLLRFGRETGHTIAEHVGRHRDGVTPVTLRAFLAEDEYNALPEMTAKEPRSLDDETLLAQIRQDLISYMAARTRVLGGAPVPGSLKCTKLVLSLYAARRFALIHGERAWFFVGDAAAGVPYFRALNSGLIMGSRLAQIIGRTAWPSEGVLETKVRRFEQYRPMHVQTEFAIARAKDAVLQSASMARRWYARPKVFSPGKPAGL